MKSWTVRITNGHIPRSVSLAIKELLSRQPTGKAIEITIREWHPTRSKKQNAAYWAAIVAPIREYMNDFGNNLTDDEVHEFLKQHIAKSLFVKRVQMCDGSFETIVRSSKNLTTKEFADFIELCRAWATSEGIYMPSFEEHVYD